MRSALPALALLLVFATAASAQPQQPLPLAPGVRPAAPTPVNPLPPGTIQPATLYLPGFAPHQTYNPWMYQTYSPWTGFGYTYTFGGVLPAGNVVPVAPTAPPSREPTIADLSGEVPAMLTLQFPASADMWLNGAKRDKSGEEHTLTSPVLKPGERHTFDVKARWKTDGKTYETTRKVILGSGDRSRLLVVSGTEVKE